MTYGSEVISRGNAIELSMLTNIGVAVVKFDAVESRVNVLSSSVMTELEAVVDLLATGKIGKQRIFGAVFSSGKPDSFIVGADIQEIVMAQSMPESVAYEGSKQGKTILAKLSALPFPTVAAIHGRCLGGGTELALACRERLVSRKAMIGLPEVALGVLPGWGGTVAAPKLLGFAAALALILNPVKAWSAAKAWNRGLVSEVVRESELFDRAIRVALGAQARHHKPSLLARTLRAVFDSGSGRALASAGMKLAIKLQTRGKYPAPLAALKVMNAAFEMPVEEAREFESRTFAELCQTPACKHCVQKFLDYQKEKKNKASTA